MINKENAEQPSISTFAQIVDKLRNKNEEELNSLQLTLLSSELISEWENLTKDADFNNASEEDIIKAIQMSRYHLI